MFCNHMFVDGFGMMGDALTCEKCGLSKYPEVMPVRVAIAAALGRIIEPTHPDYKEHRKKAQEAADARRMRYNPDSRW